MADPSALGHPTVSALMGELRRPDARLSGVHELVARLEAGTPLPHDLAVGRMLLEALGAEIARREDGGFDG